MIIIDPVTLGDVACTRASPKAVFDRNGTVVQVPPNTLAVTYDPGDPASAPYALIEGPAVNYVEWSENFGAPSWIGYWQKPTLTAGVAAPDGSSNATRCASWDAPGSPGKNESGLIATSPGVINGIVVVSIWARCVSGTLEVYLGVNDAFQSGALQLTTQWRRLQYVTPAPVSIGIGDRLLQIRELTAQNVEWEVWGAQAEQAGVASSYIRTNGAAATRAADVIGSGAGVVYSNVPVTEPTYNASMTYAKDALVYDPVTHNVFQSVTDANKGQALNTAAWAPRGATNRWAMLDQYNNTQTTAQDEILLVVSPKSISRGIYVGNVDATEVRISVVDPVRGLVYQETKSLRLSTSGSSFFSWCFNRIRRRSWAVSLDLPPYYGALVTISIRKPGGTVACGMCAVGPTMDLGKTLMGLGAEIRDFSETSFNFDGTSTTKRRNWAKRITADISVDSDQVEAVYEELARLRQKPIVWVGSPKFGLSIAFARYSAIKPVIKGATRWEMSAQLEGTI